MPLIHGSTLKHNAVAIKRPWRGGFVSYQQFLSFIVHKDDFTPWDPWICKRIFLCVCMHVHACCVLHLLYPCPSERNQLLYRWKHFTGSTNDAVKKPTLNCSVTLLWTDVTKAQLKILLHLGVEYHCRHTFSPAYKNFCQKMKHGAQYSVDSEYWWKKIEKDLSKKSVWCFWVYQWSLSWTG